jgi:ABC-type dipeptide/oligopeptide/nickel transport system ATPase subunit
VKQEKVLDALRESIDHLKTEIVNLEHDIRLLEFHFAEKLKVLHSSKVLSHFLLGMACILYDAGGTFCLLIN